MDFGKLDQLKLCYQSKNMTTEEKILNITKNIPELKDFYVDDLKILFDEQLPFIEGVEIVTKFGDKFRKYVAITKMQDKISVDVQKAIMRIAGCIGGFKIEKWGIGQKTDAMNRHLKEYMVTHGKMKPLQYVLGDIAKYPKVLEVCWNEVEGAGNESYTVTEIVGLMLS